MLGCHGQTPIEATSKEVMNRAKLDDNTLPFQALTLFRGLYKRIAMKLDVDPSYVSRVARGERRSEVIEAALRKEMQKILGNGGDGHNTDGHGSKAHRGKPSTASRTVAGRIDGDSQGRREGA